jgi:hypothetical protein
MLTRPSHTREEERRRRRRLPLISNRASPPPLRDVVAGRSRLLTGGQLEDGDRDPEALADAVEQAALLPPGAVFGPGRDEEMIG